MCLKGLFKKNQFLPERHREITFVELWTFLHNLFPKAQIFISDSTKYLCDIDDINKFLAADDTNRRKYKAEEYDCDDFAYRLMGQFSVEAWASLAKAIVWTDVHALNGFIDTNMKWWFIEPQQDTLNNELAEWQGSKVRLVVI